ncbi:FxsA family protein [Sulfitobacter sp. F26169L]|uniref:FxsA family protein n=1 Tax=Sulfitobacter sp. F26169L TaxID=2996015 RepID=UPI002260FE72|nr:FxsA family protein [Sulfitobacter sp. F26169L]MCX7565884.1 FxsA family protein [Sulfitobacter sp. F26169L]
MWLLIAFIAVPVIEIALFIQVGGFIGLWPTLLIVILTALAGTYLVRSQGRLALGQLQSSFSDLRDPTEPLVHGAMILFSGALLLTPGFFTDAVGFALLVPAIRHSVFKAIRARVNVQSFSTSGASPHRGPTQPRRNDDIIDGEFIELPDDDAPKGNSKWTKN